MGIFFVLCITIFSVRVGYLQIYKGEAYLKRSENNTLEKQIIFADRGIIYDRNKIEIAWNKKSGDEKTVPTRAYLYPGFSTKSGDYFSQVN